MSRHHRVMDALEKAEEKARAENTSLQAEHDEDMAWYDKWSQAIEDAAGYLNREFPEVPSYKWSAALKNPERAQFTSDKKQQRFEAAFKWVEEKSGTPR